MSSIIDPNAVTNYKGRVWTCDEHNNAITALIESGELAKSNRLLTSIHPKRGNSCAECARLYLETPACNR